jgi:hypothetical protein
MYTKGQFISFIEKCFGSGTQSNQGANLSVVCPICKQKEGGNYTKRKLVIQTAKGYNHCWICNYKSRNVANLLRRYHPGYLTEYLTTFVGTQQLRCAEDSVVLPDQEEPDLKLPSGFVLLAAEMSKQANMYLSYRTALNYIAERFNTRLEDLNSTDMWYWKFGISLNDQRYANRVIMPSFDMSGELNYYTCRAIYKTRPKYINPGVHREDIIFNEMNINWKEPLILVEGPLDLIKCGDRNATCLLGSDLTSDYKLFLLLAKNKTPVTLALDPDAKQKTLRIAEFLSEYDIPVKILDIPEPYQDVGEMTKEEFSSILSSAIVYTKDYLLRAKISNILRT